MRKRCKILAVLLAASLCFSAVPLEAFAEGTEVAAEQTEQEIVVEEPETDSAEVETAEADTAKVEAKVRSVESNAVEEIEADGDPGYGRLSGTDIPAEFYGPMSKARSYQHNSKFDGYTIQKGIDVSKWNGTIDWKKVKKAGIDFAFVRVAYRTYGSGSLEVDPVAAKNLKGAVAAGIPVGVYIFSQAITEKEAVAEADWLLKHIKGYDVTLPVILDYEYTAGSAGRLYKAKYITKKLTKRKMTDICLAFCKRVEAVSDYTPMVYANKSMLKDDLYASEISKSYPVWLAHYTSKTDYAGDYNYWQYSEKGSVSGISGRVDMNFGYVKDVNKVSKVTVSKKTTDSITLSWKPVNSADGYEVYKKDASGEYTRLADVAGETTYTDQGLEEGTAYSYKVCSYVNKEDGTKEWHEYSPSVTGITMINGVTVTGKASAFDTIKLYWKKAAGASGYEIQRYDSSDKRYETIRTLTSGSTVSYTNGSRNASTTYKYRIRAYKNVGSSKAYSAYSNEVSVKTKGSVKGKVTASSVNVRTGPSTSYKALKTVRKNTTLTITGTRDSWYRTSVTVSGKKKTAYIAKKYVKLSTSESTTVSKPGRTTLSASGVAFDKVKLTWKKVSGATGYKVQRYSPSKKEYVTIKIITSGSTVSYTNGSLNSSTTYKYRIRAYKKSGSKTINGDYSASDSAKTKHSVKGKTTATNINVRSGAGTSYKTLKRVGKNVTLTITGSNGDWYRTSVTVNGKKKTAYIVKKYVKLL